MDTNTLLNQIPSRRIVPRDGMSVTGDVWAEAHHYHRQHQQLHNLLAHRPGILIGLDVIASDPPDHAVYILPGVAIDSQGRVVVVPEPLTYALGDQISTGTFYLTLSYDESNPQPDDTRVYEEGDPLYSFSRYSLEARHTIPDAPLVELARLRVDNPAAPLKDAVNPAAPQIHEIDLRFRQEVGTKPTPIVTIAVCYVGDEIGVNHTRGVSLLAKTLAHTESYRICVDHNVPLTGSLASYTLVYLVGLGKVNLSADEMNVLYEYLQQRGTLLIEACRRNEANPTADAPLKDMLESMGVLLKPLAPGDNLLTRPYLFAAAPPGYTSVQNPAVEIADGVIFSTADYGCLWQLEQQTHVPTRAEIRAATEWGANIITYALTRQGK